MKTVPIIVHSTDERGERPNRDRAAAWLAGVAPAKGRAERIAGKLVGAAVDRSVGYGSQGAVLDAAFDIEHVDGDGSTTRASLRLRYGKPEQR